MIAVPEIGSKVRVTTRYLNAYIYRAEGEDYVTTVREGTVVQSVYKDPTMFAIRTGNPSYPVSAYDAKKVVSIELLSGKFKNIDFGTKAWKVTNGEKIYLVTRVNGKYSCSCKGFLFRRDCKHIGAVEKK